MNQKGKGRDAGVSNANALTAYTPLVPLEMGLCPGHWGGEGTMTLLKQPPPASLLVKERKQD